MVLMGCAIFAVLLFAGAWASIGYWIPLIAAAGLVAERQEDRPVVTGDHEGGNGL